MANKYEIPADFPREESGALPGGATKYIAKQVGGRYVVGLTEEELCQRYEGCRELLRDLVAYCERKQRELPTLSASELYSRVEQGLLANTDVGTTSAENKWVLRKLCLSQGWAIDGSH